MSPSIVALLIWSLGAYLIGAVPNGLLYSLYVEGEDLRSQGSGNIGATNVLRNFGWSSGLVVLFLDVAKGAAPLLAYLALTGGTAQGSVILACLGAAPVLGHVYPVYLGFSGGKGVATATGVFLVLVPLELGLATVVFFGVVLATRYVSAGSLSAALVFPILVWYQNHEPPLILLAAGVAVLIIWRHRENITRLIKGEENPFYGA